MKWILCAAVGLGLASGGCGSGIGPKSISNERPAFNEELIQSTNQQLLTNLVRLRYLDAPMFLELSSVVAQYSFDRSVNASGSASFSGGEWRRNGSGIGVGGSMDFKETPTVSYMPLQGEEFAKRMLSPIPLETIVLLSRSGRSSARLLNICAERMNGLENAVSASGPTPAESPTYEEFQKTAAQFKRLGKLGVFVVVPDKDSSHKVAYRVDAAKAAQLNASEDLSTVLKTLDLPANTRMIVLSTPFEQNDGTTLVLSTRSMLGVLFFLSHSVQAPPEHVTSGLVERTKIRGTETLFDWAQVTKSVMTVKWAPKEPERAYVKVKYRDYWFYIDDADRNSKATFGLLHYLISLQSTAGSGRMPLLTLPAGG